MITEFKKLKLLSKSSVISSPSSQFWKNGTLQPKNQK